MYVPKTTTAMMISSPITALICSPKGRVGKLHSQPRVPRKILDTIGTFLLVSCFAQLLLKLFFGEVRKDILSIVQPSGATYDITAHFFRLI